MRKAFDADLSRKVEGFRTGVLSFVDDDGFPISLPVSASNVDRDRLELKTQLSSMKWPGNTRKACLLFHSYDDGLENLRQLLLRGRGILAEERFFFDAKSVFEFQRKGGFLAALRFIIEGKKNARRYLKRLRDTRVQL